MDAIVTAPLMISALLAVCMLFTARTAAAVLKALLLTTVWVLVGFSLINSVGGAFFLLLSPWALLVFLVAGIFLVGPGIGERNENDLITEEETLPVTEQLHPAVMELVRRGYELKRSDSRWSLRKPESAVVQYFYSDTDLENYARAEVGGP